MLTQVQCQFFWRNNEQSKGEHLSGVIDHCTLNTSVCLPDLIRELPYFDLLHKLNVTHTQRECLIRLDRLLEGLYPAIFLQNKIKGVKC